jgi:hypothetical protein
MVTIIRSNPLLLFLYNTTFEDMLFNSSTARNTWPVEKSSVHPSEWVITNDNTTAHRTFDSGWRVLRAKVGYSSGRHIIDFSLSHQRGLEGKTHFMLLPSSFSSIVIQV